MDAMHPQMGPFGGEEGIRTLDTLASTAVYETAALSRSATSIEALQGSGSTQAATFILGFGGVSKTSY